MTKARGKIKEVEVEEVEEVTVEVKTNPSAEPKRYSIDLDCAPGNPRPGDLFPQVIEGTGLEEKDFVNISRFFGNWVWALNPEKNDAYKAVRPTIQERIENLYNSGYIRYGSW